MTRTATQPPASDEGWPYPDGEDGPPDPDEVDLDLLELRVDPHAFEGLTQPEREALRLRFGLDNTSPHSMKQLAHKLSLTHGQTRELLGSAIDKVRARLLG